MNIQNHTNKDNCNYRILEPFRNIGKVIDGNKPFYYKRAHQRFLLTTNSFAFTLYNLDRLKIERQSPTFYMPKDIKISSMFAYKEKIYISIKNKIYVFHKLHIIKEYNHKVNINQIEVFNTALIIQDIDGYITLIDLYSFKKIKGLDIKSEMYIHPTSYLNKIVYTPKHNLNIDDKIAYTLSLNEDNRNGNHNTNNGIKSNLADFKNNDVSSCLLKSHNLILYNINTEKVIYSSKINPETYSNNNNSLITCIEQSPIIDIICLGFSTGDILCINLKNFVSIKSFKSNSKIISLSFCDCETLSKTPMLASVDNSNKINIWDLNNSQLFYTFNNESFGYNNINHVYFINNEPLLIITSEHGNFIKMFIFNENSEFFSIPKLLKERNGFVNNPNKVRFYGEDERHIVAISNNQLKLISTINEHISKDYSTKKLYNNNINLNFTDFDINMFRERDWSNVLVLNKSKNNDLNSNFNIFNNHKLPLFFSSDNKNLNSNTELEKNLLKGLKSYNNNKIDNITTIDYQDLTAISISYCGHFGFAGYSKGLIVKFNMQSGNVKKIISNNTNSIENKFNNNFGSIISIKTDGLNSVVISISNFNICWWDFLTMDILHQKEINSENIPFFLEIEKNKEYVAVAFSSNVIDIYNKSNYNKIRSFNISNLYLELEHINYNTNLYITDICFGNDGNWLCVTTSKNSLIIYDVKSCEVIEFIIFNKKTPVSVSMSENNIFIAVSYANENYISLLINREKFYDVISSYDNLKEQIISLNSSNNDKNGNINKYDKLLNIDTINPLFIENYNSLLNSQIKILKGRTMLHIGSIYENVVNNIDKKESNEVKKKINSLSKPSKLIEFSNENRSKYRLIMYYDFMTKLTKPKVMATEKTSAPFFLYNVNEEFNKSSIKLMKEEGNKKNALALLQNSTLFNENKSLNNKLYNDNKLNLNSLLEKLYENSIKPYEITKYLISLSPEVIDLEIRNLAPELNLNNKSYINNFILLYLKEEVKSNKNFELIQSFVNRFLKIYSENMLFNNIDVNNINDIEEDNNIFTAETIEALKNIKDTVKSQLNHLESLFKSCLCLVSNIAKIEIGN